MFSFGCSKIVEKNPVQWFVVPLPKLSLHPLPGLVAEKITFEVLSENCRPMLVTCSSPEKLFKPLLKIPLAQHSQGRHHVTFFKWYLHLMFCNLGIKLGMSWPWSEIERPSLTSTWWIKFLNLRLDNLFPNTREDKIAPTFWYNCSSLLNSSNIDFSNQMSRKEIFFHYHLHPWTKHNFFLLLFLN